MDIRGLRIGILHSLIGKNDGVSIVIDQSIKTMTERMRIPLDNLFFLAGHSAPRFQTRTHDIFWHRNEQNKFILQNFSEAPPKGFYSFISEHVMEAKRIIAKFVEENSIDLFIIHNGCHPSNFIYAAAAGMYFEEKRRQGYALPKYLLWWHDSHYERERFSRPNEVIQKFLRYIPGPNVDGIVFINSTQAALAKQYFEDVQKMKNAELYFQRKTCTIPNTCSIPWDFEEKVKKHRPLVPPQDQYNRTFLRDIGLTDRVEALGCSLNDAVILLQHTRVVQRKRIDIAIDFIFKLAERYFSEFKDQCENKVFILLVSGHSGDEHDSHRAWLEKYFEERQAEHPDYARRVMLIFAEHLVFPGREVVVDRKYYAFEEVPGVVAALGGMGTYFSEVEGYGNNLLEMISYGLPVIINRYDIYTSDIEELGFDLVVTEKGDLTAEAVDRCYALLNDPDEREKTVLHNLRVLRDKLNHGVMADKLAPLIENLFRYN